MKRGIHVPNLYAFGPVIVGPIALVSLQEGCTTLAGLLGLGFVALVAGGVRKLRVYRR